MALRLRRDGPAQARHHDLDRLRAAEEDMAVKQEAGDAADPRSSGRKILLLDQFP